MKTIHFARARKMPFGETDRCATNSSRKSAKQKAREKKQPKLLAIATSALYLVLHTPPAIAGENQPGNIKPTKKSYKTMVAQFNSILSYDGSLKGYDRVPVPEIDFLIANPNGERTPKCGEYEMRILYSGYCPHSDEIFLTPKKINDQGYNDHYATQAITGTNILSAYIVAREVADHAVSTLGFEFENSVHKSLMLDCYSGEILGSVYSSPAETVANDMSRFMNLGLEKHSGGDPNLTAIKRAAFQFGFNPSNSCLSYTPPGSTGSASD
ncbi:hypothetical protein I4641_13750 [Waterburya agarophytonicola K14]|uniref:Uncharacterized protein n=1 Tax=Waterburya agarophytonicola KI4 TaxID=2874699 RepID=A0A964BRU9_9CYAN|nr:hypothetical protein [Waterburya agarophytonicola]MCC0178044.1 hypothetical protein [Waterburya agarophytonicola KI4]